MYKTEAKAKEEPKPIKKRPKEERNTPFDEAKQRVPNAHKRRPKLIIFLELTQSKNIPDGICIIVYETKKNELITPTPAAVILRSIMSSGMITLTDIWRDISSRRNSPQTAVSLCLVQ